MSSGHNGWLQGSGYDTLAMFLAGLRSREDSAWRVVAQVWVPWLERLLVCRLRLSSQDAAEIRQAALCRLAEPAVLERLDAERSPLDYFLTIGVNEGRNLLRRRGEVPPHVSLTGSEAAPPAVDSEDQEAPEPGDCEGERQTDIRAQVREALAELSDGDRLMLIAVLVEGRKPEEVALSQGKKAGAVRVALHRARQRLRDRLAKRGIQLVAPAAPPDHETPGEEVAIDE